MQTTIVIRLKDDLGGYISDSYNGRFVISLEDGSKDTIYWGQLTSYYTVAWDSLTIFTQ